MNDIFLIGLIVFLVLALLYREEVNKSERKDLLRMIKANTLDEVSRAELVDKQEETEEEVPEYKSLESATDEEFDEAIKAIQ